MNRLVDFSDLFLDVRVGRLGVGGAFHLGLILREITFAQMQQHEVANGIGARQRALELEDRVVDADSRGVDDAEPIVRLFIVRVASEKLLVDRLGAIEAPLTVIEVAEKTRGIGGFRMGRDKTRE